MFLYLVQLAHAQNPARGSIRELSRWLGADRRPCVTRTHLDRVLSCTIMRPRADGYERLEIGRLHWVDENTFEIQFGDVFCAEARQGAPYSLERATQWRSHPATLDLYLCLALSVQILREYTEFTHEVDPKQLLPLATNQNKARQALVQRIEAIQDALQEVHISPAAQGTGVLLDFGAPKRTIHLGVSRVDWQAHSQQASEIRQLPPDERRALGHLMQMIAECERRMEEPDPWTDARDAIRRAEEDTAQILERLKVLTEL